MLLVLHRSDLGKNFQHLPLDEVDVIHVSGSSMKIMRSNMVMFYDHKTDAIKVLKNRYGKPFTQFSEK